MESSFSGIVAFAVLCVLMLLGTVLRAKVGFLQRNLIPASLSGGIIGFVLLTLLEDHIGWSYNYGTFTFHFFTLSFMSLCLTVPDPQPGQNSRTVILGGLWLSLVWIASLVLQALLGFGVIYILNLTSTDAINPYIGVLSTHGFTQGPGQALAFGTIWEQEFAVREAANIGIIYASVGFIVAFLVGIPVARWAISRGLNANKNAAITPEFLRGLYDPQSSSAKAQDRQVTHPSNIENLAYHICLLGAAYLLTHAWLTGMQSVIEGYPETPTWLEVLFRHDLFFAHGLMICLIARKLITYFGLAQYLDSSTQKRITGSAIDFMVIGALLSIKFAILLEFLVPIFAVVVAISAATILLCYLFGRQLRELGVERGLAIFGCCTGSTGSGLLLLRLLDPDFKTTVPQELAFFNFAIILLTLHILMFVAPTLPSFGELTFFALYGGTLAACLCGLALLQKHMKKIG